MHSAGAQQTWRGHVEYAPELRYPVEVAVTISAPYKRVVATEPVRVGERITASKLRLETGVGAPERRDTAESIDEVAGRVARRLIPAGSAVERASLGELRVVARGDALELTVVSGHARLRLEGVAMQPGAAGALVAVRVPSTGRVVHARVDEVGRATVDVGVASGEN
jgi:flagella basal body P-ring formation protein FlgA